MVTSKVIKEVNMYFLFTEKFHFLNLFNMPRSILLFCVYLAIGIVLRCLIKTKREFYKVSLVAFIIWLLCEIACSVIAAKDLTGVLGIMDFAFRVGWILFCVLLGAWLFHLACFLLHKKKLQ